MSDTLRDIKPLLEIVDSSYYIYVGLIFISVFLVISTIVFVGRNLWINRKRSIEEIYLERLKSIDWSNAKKASYDVTFLAYHFIDNERVKEIYSQTIPLLEKYKYRKEVPTVDTETLRQYELLVHVIDDAV
jgi:hypothetical protein